MRRNNQFARSSGSFRSGLEKKAAAQLDANETLYTYEKDVLEYTVPSIKRKYTPDFKLIKKAGPPMFIETKGYWDGEDRKKHFLIKKEFPHLDLRFVFNNPNAKIRKGSNTTYADVCSGRLRGQKDFIVPFAKAGKEQIIPQEWLEEAQ